MTAGNDSPSKQQLRQRFRQRRQQLDRQRRLAWDQQIQEHLLDLPFMSANGRVAAYWSFDGEPDLLPALRTLNAGGTRICLPIVPDEPGAELELHPWRPDRPMSGGRLGQLEPEASEAVPAGALDVVLIPLVAWDPDGHRLGMGAGYYDRFLEPVRGAQKPLRVGVAYSVQRADVLPGDPWDVPLHALLCERGLIQFGPV